MYYDNNETGDSRRSPRRVPYDEGIRILREREQRSNQEFVETITESRGITNQGGPIQQPLQQFGTSSGCPQIQITTEPNQFCGERSPTHLCRFGVPITANSFDRYYSRAKELYEQKETELAREGDRETYEKLRDIKKTVIQLMVNAMNGTSAEALPIGDHSPARRTRSVCAVGTIWNHRDQRHSFSSLGSDWEGYHTIARSGGSHAEIAEASSRIDEILSGMSDHESIHSEPQELCRWNQRRPMLERHDTLVATQSAPVGATSMPDLDLAVGFEHQRAPVTPTTTAHGETLRFSHTMLHFSNSLNLPRDLQAADQSGLQ